MKKRGFSVAELLIVVAVLGIMAAIVVPQFQSQSTRAKKAVAKDSLRILRSAIELYIAQHSGIPPGYKDDDPQKVPKNPFNNLRNIRMIGNNEAFPPDAVNGYAWIYQAATKTIRLNWPGSDSSGVRYFDY